MPEIIIPREKIEVRRIELEKKLNTSVDGLRKKVDKYTQSYGKAGNICYKSVLNAFSYQAAVEYSLYSRLPFANKTKQSIIFSLYIASKIGLEDVVERQEESTKTKDFFSKNLIDLTQLIPHPADKLLDMYGKIVDLCTEQFDLEELTYRYFEWINDETLKYSEEKSMLELDAYLKKNPVIIQERKFTSFGISSNVDSITYTWDKIGGYEEIKEECKDIALTIRNFEFMKKRQEDPLPTGFLFYGPPGTGKTLLTKTIANEAGVPFEMIDRASIASTYKDGSVEKINKIFRKVKSYITNGISPAAILSIDEIDSIGASRGDHREDDKVVNTLLTNMDGNSTPGMIYFGSTNRLDMIDQALLRSGRFTRQIKVGYPVESDRENIFRTIISARKKYAIENNKERNFYNGLDFHKLAKESEKFTGADIQQITGEVIRKQSRAYLKNQTPIRPVTTEDILNEINLHRRGYKK